MKPPAETPSRKILGLIGAQKEYFLKGETRELDFRKSQLKRLKLAIEARENIILEALQKDLGKSAFEGYASETGIILEEIKHALKWLPRWMAERAVPVPLSQFPAYASITPEPFGNVLIIAPYNYPFHLAIAPLVAAIAAGNTAIIKPSELVPHTSLVIRDLIGQTFPENYIAVVEGGRPTNTALLKQRFDMIFFTGGTAVGKIVMQAAAKYLTPVVLELGGKSPCIVDGSVNLKTAARRIAWGRFWNAGQTCVAPDYLLVERSVKDRLLPEIKASIEQFYGSDPAQSKDYGRIVNQRHFDRLKKYLKNGKVFTGGQISVKERYIAPTVLTDVKSDSPVMQEEIFGPILPVMEYGTEQEAIDFINSRPRPLALYLFTANRKFEREVLKRTTFGGGCVNDTMVHLSVPDLPFGGVGDSGMGAYHGRMGFEAFSYKRSVLRKSRWIDIPLRYPPFNGPKFQLLKKFMG
ncbi:MAG: aldehyde dehydrogenase [Spirochaetales bacterium]|nr:aldehyde dehydrogenase [Spirochaetales bacterium]